MMSRLVRAQLVIFVLVTVVGLGAMLLVYVRLPELLGVGVHPLTVQFPRNAGLYANAKVLYRGVEIGQVDDVDVTSDGVTAKLTVADSARVPRDSRAAIRSMSAAGEQYLEFVSVSGAGPYLASGSTVPADRTVLPTDTGPLLDQVQALLSALPKRDLTSVLDEAHRAFNGAGPDLGRLLDGTSNLVGEAQRNLGPTRKLIADAGPVLDTQVAEGNRIRSLTADLSRFTGQLRSSDHDLRDLLRTGRPLAGEADDLFQQLRPTVPVLLDNLVSVGQVGVTYNPALRQVLVLYPLVVTTLQTITLPLRAEGSANLDFRTVVNDPPPCTLGFLPVKGRRDVEDLSLTTTPNDLYCKLPPSDPAAARGARNAPCLDVPGRRAAMVQDCHGAGFRPEGVNSPLPPAGQTPSRSGPDRPPMPMLGARPPSGVTAYDRSTGGYTGPDGHLYVLGGSGTDSSGGGRTWRDLLLGPLGP